MFQKLLKNILLSLFPLCTMGQIAVLDSYFSKLDPEIQVSMQLMSKEGEVLFARNDTNVVAAASTIKISILVEFYVQVEQKRYKERQKHKLKEEDKVGGSGDLQYEAPRDITYKKLAQEMIRVSDNTATNILIEQVGGNNVNRFLAYHGLEKTRLRRRMMDFQAVLDGKQNTTTASEMNQLLLILLQGNLLKEKYHKEIIKILLGCEDYTTFQAQLPGVPIAHKTGTLQYIRGDVGIFFGEEPFILSVYVENFESFFQAEKIISDLGKLCYGYMESLSK